MGHKTPDDYQKIGLKEARNLNDAWLTKSLPQSQWEIVAPMLKKRTIPKIAKPVVKIIKELAFEKPCLLDVGCSSGYYYDYFKQARLELKYTGCDISPHFIKLARKKHRFVDFKVASLTKLPYKDASFEIVFASGVLLYELDYGQAIKEMARVSSHYILFHRLPVFDTSVGNNLTYYRRVGYGVEMMEIIFSWRALLREFKETKLAMEKYQIGDRLDAKIPARMATILLEKKSAGQREQPA